MSRSPFAGVNQRSVDDATQRRRVRSVAEQSRHLQSNAWFMPRLLPHLSMMTLHMSLDDHSNGN
jgi:hypothetical protein